MEPEKIALLRTRLREYTDTREFAGISLLYQEKEEEPVFLASGYADLDEKRPMTRDAIFHLYSQTKPITAAAALLLVQDGILDLYDPVAKFFPSFAHQTVQTVQGPVPASHPVTIRDLLNMTSGLVYPESRTQAETATGEVFADLLKRLGTDQAMTTAEFADRLGRCPLQFDPSTDWQYGTSADVLGAVIEKASDLPLDEFMKERLFAPLGMKDTDFSVPEAKRTRLCSIYRRIGAEDLPAGTGKAASGNFGDQGAESAFAGDGPILEHYTGNNLGIRNDGGPNPFLSGGAGLFSTLDDYLLFARMLRCGGRTREGQQILRPGTVSFLTCHQLDPVQQASFHRWIGLDGHSYGNLMRVLVDRRQAGILGHNGEYGWDGWLGTYFANDPEIDATLLLGIQRYDYGTGHITRKIRNIVFS
ncbi:MAG: beta-lactamase family protein [Lachnospiraceae bacterium]|jgi:CubicO group peptidase (beta-lactamase class C family)|nr:beta-lactamase family protein [Lachnospiraceae bacterium]MCI1398307.1 beta-lactamase family protein [Lachnospiraceae bacterium]MCI1424430.1 beta-lactamase family protein [Lachnospiraceae bacterium]MCI1453207.1 beta-lactamase family protein [Lachnospiraceae bacterium]